MFSNADGNRFSSWEDIQKEFQFKEKKPTEILFAEYIYEDYSGSAIVIYRRGRKYYVNQGSHCSCHGLEGQWQPEEYQTKKIFKDVMARRNSYYGGGSSIDEIRRICGITSSK